MFRIVLAVIFLLAFTAQAEELSAGRIDTGCKTLKITMTTTEIWFTAHQRIDLTLEDGGSGVVVAIYTCIKQDTSFCGKYWWDPDLDGIRNQNTLNGNGDTFSRGTEIPGGLVTRAEVTTVPSANDLAEIQACLSYAK